MSKRLPIAKMLTFGILPSCIKKLVYRLQGNHIGRHVKFHLGSVVSCKTKFSVGDETEIGYFTSLSGDEISIGKRCNLRSAVMISAHRITIRDEVTISETAIIRAGHVSDRSEIIIDDLVHVFPHTTIDPSCRIHLHEECAVGPGCGIFTHGSYKNILEGYPVSYGDVSIGCRVELTYNVFVAPGVTIGDDAIVAYGSFVNKDLPAGVLAAGCPAVVKRTKEQFAPTPTEEQRQALVKGILDEFEKYMAFSNIPMTTQDIKVIDANEVVVNGLYHFDLVNHKCSQPRNILAKELRRFFSRYGIRFKIEE